MIKEKKLDQLAKDAKIIIAIDMGGWTAKCAIADTKGVIYHRFIVESKHKEEAVPHFNQEVRKEVAKLGIDWDKQVVAIGFGCVGPLSKGNEVSIRALKVGWINYPIKKEATRIFGKPVYVLNDARSIVHGEWKQGAGKNYDSFAIFSLGNGLGGGFVIDGKVWDGSHNSSGEVGHGGHFQEMFECQCGLPYCVEGIASASGIEKYFQYYIKKHPKSKIALRQKELGKKVRIKDVADLIKAKEASTWEAFTTPLRTLSKVISTIIFAIDPAAILIGGGPSALGEVLIDAIKDSLKDYVWPEFLKRIDFKLCELKNDAGIVGLIENAIDQLKADKK